MAKVGKTQNTQIFRGRPGVRIGSGTVRIGGNVKLSSSDVDPSVVTQKGLRLRAGHRLTIGAKQDPSRWQLNITEPPESANADLIPTTQIDRAPTAPGAELVILLFFALCALCRSMPIRSKKSVQSSSRQYSRVTGNGSHQRSNRKESTTDAARMYRTRSDYQRHSH